MRNKLFKILGVVLTVALVASLFAFAAPVAAQAYTPNRWNAMTIPAQGPPYKLLNGGDVSDFAVGSDGTTIYAVDISASSATGTSILKSTTSGMMWADVAEPTVPPAVAFTAPARLVAVAPDNPSAVAIVDSGGAGADRVFFSTNGGAVWSDMGAPVAAGEVITDIAVSSANAAALLGRNIVVSTSDGAAAAAGVDGLWGTGDDVGVGGVYLIGDTATWSWLGAPAGLNLGYDYTSVDFEPNWLGGRSVVAIGSGSSLAPVPNGTFFQVLRTAPLAPAVVCNFNMSVTAAIGPGLGPFEIGNAAGLAIVSSSLALPSDFDSTAPPGIQAYVGINSAVASGDDVYRQDFNQTRKLQIAADVAIHSISFTGTLAGGTLFAGEVAGAAVGAAAQVWYSANPETALPSWAFSYKPPTGSVGLVNANVKVQVAPDFDTSGIVYAGTGGNVGGDESAFSRTTNGGVSYNQIGLIDTTIVALDDVMPAPDNSVLFLSSNNGANSSLWRSSTPPSGGSWERVGLAPTTVGYIIRLSPDYLTDSTLYWCDFGGTAIMKSTDGGEIFAPRTGAGNIADLTVESQEIVYMAQAATDNVYKSTNGAWYWGLPIAANTGGVWSIAMCPTYPEKPKAGNVLVGSTTGAVSLSTDGGASFMPLLVALPVGPPFNLISVLADKDYATNNIVYAATTARGLGVFRYEVGVSTAWENIRIPNGPASTGGEATTGLAMEGGTLYAAWTDFVAGVPFPAGVERTLSPFLPDIAALTFVTMNVGAAGCAFNAVPSSLRAAGTATETWLWAIDTFGVALMAYNDTMAKAILDVTVPATVGNDPSTGRNFDFVISWNKPSNALAYNVGIFTDAGCTQWVAGAAAVAAPPVGYVPPMPLAPSWNVPNGVLAGGTKYYVRVYATDQTTFDAIDSPRDPGAIKVVSFTVEAGTPVTMPAVGPTLLSPTCGDTNAPLRPGFSWSTMPKAEKYEFILATDSALTQTIAGTPVEVTAPNFQLDADLAYSTTYFYAVKVTAPTSSPQSICSFTTMAVPVEPTPPVTIPEAPAPITPAWIWAIVIIGAILVIAVIVLIVTTRRVP